MNINLHGVSPQQWAAIAADVLEAEADLIMKAPSESEANGVMWSAEASRRVQLVGAMMKSRAALLRAKVGAG